MTRPSPEVTFLVNFLRDRSPGDLVTYQEFSKIAGLERIQDHRHCLDSAIRIAQREHGIYVRCVRKTGYEVVANEAVPITVSELHSTRIRTRCSRWRDVIHHTGQASTPDGGRALAKCFNAETSVSRTIHETIDQMPIRTINSFDPEKIRSGMTDIMRSMG